MRGIGVPAQLLAVYLLLHLRFMGLMFSSPVFISVMSPTPVRYLFAVLLTAAAIGTAGPTELPLVLFEDVISLALLGLRELLVGIVLGVLSSLPLVAVRLAGEQASAVIGFSMAQMMDPTTQSQNSVLGQMLFLVTLWFYFHWNGHLLMLQAVMESLKLVPLGRLSPFPAGEVAVGAWIQGLFVLGIRMVLPFYCALVLADVGLGFLARTVPQMNVFVLGGPVKIALGFLVLTAVLPLMTDLIFTQFERWIEFALGGVLYWNPVP